MLKRQHYSDYLPSAVDTTIDSSYYSTNTSTTTTSTSAAASKPQDEASKTAAYDVFCAEQKEKENQQLKRLDEFVLQKEDE